MLDPPLPPSFVRSYTLVSQCKHVENYFDGCKFGGSRSIVVVVAVGYYETPLDLNVDI